MSKLRKNNLVAQSNKLIEGRYKATKHELTLLVSAISLIEPGDESLLTFSVSVGELSRVLNLDTKSALREFKKISRRLSSKVVEVETEEGWRIFPWMSLCELRGNIITLQFNENLKPYLVDLKKSGNFTQYRLAMVTSFNSNYTIRMYQLLREYYSKKIYEFEFSLDSFKKMMLGEETKSYPIFKRFREAVINKAQKELSEIADFDIDGKTPIYKSDLNFELTTRRTGRKISHLMFTIKVQQTKPTIVNKSSDDAEEIPPIILEFEKLGIHRDKTKPYLDERGEQALINTLNKIKDDHNNGKIKTNVQGYAFRLLKENAGQPSTQDLEDQARKEAAKKAEAERRKKEKIEKMTSDLEREFGHIAREGFLLSRSNAEMDELLTQVEKDCEQNNALYYRKSLRKLKEGDIEEANSISIRAYVNAYIPNYEADKQTYIHEGLQRAGLID